VPTQDTQTLLVTTLDNHIRLMDMTNGKMLNEFTGHVNEAYRCRACFGHAEATVICGDEKGVVWAWDLVDVSKYFSKFHFCVKQSKRQKSYPQILPQRHITRS